MLTGLLGLACTKRRSSYLVSRTESRR